MNQDQKQPETREQPSAPQVLEALPTPNASLNVEAGLVKGEVAEVAQTSVGENQGAGGAQVQDEQAAQATDAGIQNDREALRQHLLKNAPKERVMRAQVERVLLKQKEKLEPDIRAHRRKRNYHHLRVAIMKLRLVMRELETLAKASFEALRDMWLKMLHNFA